MMNNKLTLHRQAFAHQFTENEVRAELANHYSEAEITSEGGRSGPETNHTGRNRLDD